MLNKTTLARPYAKAAFEEALKTSSLSSWDTFLKLMAIVVEEYEVKRLLQDPRFDAEQRLAFLYDVSESVLSEAGKNFLKLLAAQDRFLLLPDILVLFEQYRIEQEKKMNVRVISAVALQDSEKQKLIEKLKKRLHREVTLDCKIEPTLVGGLVIHAGDLVIDGSVQGKLARLSAELMN